MTQALTPQTLDVDTPATISYSSATSTDGSWDNTGTGIRYLIVKNDSTDTDVVCTVDSQTACDQGSDHDLTDTCSTTDDIKYFGPFNQSRYNDSDGYVQYELDGTADVSLAVVEVPIV